jgi:uncharacterized membrane protein YqjE
LKEFAIDVPFTPARRSRARRLHKKEGMNADINDSRSIADILSELKLDVTELVREEINLARVERSEKGRRVKRGAASFVLGVVVALAGMLSLVAAAILLIDRALQNPWLSSAIVGVVLLAVGFLSVVSARKHFEDLAPRETVESLRRSKELLEKQVAPRHADTPS